MLQVEDHIKILIDIAGVWPRLSFERIGQLLLCKTLKKFKPKSPIYRPLVAFQNIVNSCDFWELFLKFSHW